MINEILIWVYLINFVFLMMHETDASYWKEWRLFGKWGKSLSDKQGLSIFILARLPICIPLLYGMLNLNHQSGLIISAILSVFLIFHFFIHGVMLLVSLNMWIPVIGLTKEIKQLSDPGKIAYLFMQSLLPTIPASFLAFGTEPLYSAFLEVDNIFDVSVINDQTMAGLVLKLGGGLILWIFILITWMKWYKTEKTFDDVVRTSTND